MTTNYNDLLDRFCNLKSISPGNIHDLQMFTCRELDKVLYVYSFYQQANDIVLDVLDYDYIACTKET